MPCRRRLFWEECLQIPKGDLRPYTAALKQVIYLLFSNRSTTKTRRGEDASASG